MDELPTIGHMSTPLPEFKSPKVTPLPEFKNPKVTLEEMRELPTYNWFKTDSSTK